MHQKHWLPDTGGPETFITFGTPEKIITWFRSTRNKDYLISVDWKHWLPVLVDKKQWLPDSGGSETTITSFRWTRKIDYLISVDQKQWSSDFSASETLITWFLWIRNNYLIPVDQKKLITWLVWTRNKDYLISVDWK